MTSTTPTNNTPGNSSFHVFYSNIETQGNCFKYYVIEKFKGFVQYLFYDLNNQPRHVTLHVFQQKTVLYKNEMFQGYNRVTSIVKESTTIIP